MYPRRAAECAAVEDCLWRAALTNSGHALYQGGTATLLPRLPAAPDATWRNGDNGRNQPRHQHSRTRLQDDERTVSVSLPFTYNLYGQPFKRAIVAHTVTLAFTTNGNTSRNYCLPRTTSITPSWRTGTTLIAHQPACRPGHFTFSGRQCPFRIFNLEWRACQFGNGCVRRYVHFEVRLYSGQIGSI